ncbi:MAG TPA: RDD family protein [Jatrophihabitans sp.]|nr:RDD family protein [Jatrophihabitans sp.]
MTDPNQPSEQPPPYGQSPGFGQPPPYSPPPSSEQPPPYGPPPGYNQPPPSDQPPPYGQGPYGQAPYGQPAGFGAPPPQQQYGYPSAPPAPPTPVGPGGLVLDPGSGLYIPYGTELASVGRRIGAYFLAIPLFIVTLGIGYIIWGAILWAQGTSPALKVLGMRVWQIDAGKVPGWGRMALRDIVGRFVDGVLGFITELTSFVLFASSDKRQSLHDLVASTTVLYDPNKVLG